MEYFNEFPIFIAIYKNKLDFVKIIIDQKGFDPFELYQNVTPLEFAVLNHKIEIVKFLFTQKRFIKKSSQKAQLFEYALLKNSYEVADFLIQQPSCAKISKFSSSALQIPSIMKKPSFYSSHFFNFKYEDDSDDGEITDDDDDAYISSCVHFFLQNSNDTKIESIKNELVQKNSSLFACFASYCLNETDFVTFYEKFKLAINSIEKPGKVTPLISSLMNTKYDTLNVILTKYKDKVNVNCKTAKGITPLHIICNRGRNEEIKESEKLLMTFNGLLKNEKESVKGYTPLHLAILNKNLDAIRLLLNDKDVDVNAQDSSRNTPLHYIVRSDSCYEMLTLFHDYAGKELDIMKTNINVLNNFFFLKRKRIIKAIYQKVLRF